MAGLTAPAMVARDFLSWEILKDIQYLTISRNCA